MVMTNEAPLSREQITEKLYAAVLSDVLDSAGLRRQAMRPFIRPLDESHVLFGRARTGIYANTFHVESGRNPYALEIELVDDLQAGDVLVLACGGPTERIVCWGELLTTACKVRKATGCVTDGLVRDVRSIRQLGFPVFHGGIGMLDSKGRAEMVARDVPVECGGVRVESGDWVFGDADGVVVIPSSVAAKAFKLAIEKVEGENVTRKELQAGQSLGDVYKKYGVL
jgi:4-hydroxy-4-methyl-2-oxoglutarate aldolase